MILLTSVVFIVPAVQQLYSLEMNIQQYHLAISGLIKKKKMHVIKVSSNTHPILPYMISVYVVKLFSNFICMYVPALFKK